MVAAATTVLSERANGGEDDDRYAAAGDPWARVGRRSPQQETLGTNLGDLTREGNAYRFRVDDRPLGAARVPSCSAASCWRWPAT